MRIHVSSLPQSRRRMKLLLPKPSLKKEKFGGDSRDIHIYIKIFPPISSHKPVSSLQKLVTLIRYKTPTHPNSSPLPTAPLRSKLSTDRWVASRSSSFSTDPSHLYPGSVAGCLQWTRWEADATKLHVILHCNGCEESNFLRLSAGNLDQMYGASGVTGWFFVWMYECGMQLFYGEREPTCIVRDVRGELPSTYPGMQFYMVPVSIGFSSSVLQWSIIYHEPMLGE